MNTRSGEKMINELSIKLELKLRKTTLGLFDEFNYSYPPDYKDLCFDCLLKELFEAMEKRRKALANRGHYIHDFRGRDDCRFCGMKK